MGCGVLMHGGGVECQIASIGMGGWVVGMETGSVYLLFCVL